MKKENLPTPTEEQLDASLRVARMLDKKEKELDIDPVTLANTRRSAAVKGLADGAAKGMVPSPELIADIQAWVRGEITTEDVTARVIGRDQLRQLARKAAEAGE